MRSQLTRGAEAFWKVYDGYSHLTWVSGTQAAWGEWSADLFALVSKYNP